MSAIKQTNNDNQARMKHRYVQFRFIHGKYQIVKQHLPKDQRDYFNNAFSLILSRIARDHENIDWALHEIRDQLACTINCPHDTNDDGEDDVMVPEDGRKSHQCALTYFTHVVGILCS